ncbi:MAG: hypothetical protein VX938_05125, partial [Myxococcota bacterium]|nr:hypothetical protein [Myxococcota bacterium]
MGLGLRAGRWALVLTLTACTVSTVPPVDKGDDPSAPDSTSGPSIPDGPVVCEPGDEEAVCPEGLVCEVGVQRCVECIWDEIRCHEDGARERCDAPESDNNAGITGGFCEADPCPPLEACLNEGECAPVFCEPGDLYCPEAVSARECNVSGTAWEEDTCWDGQACFEGQCELIRHNVLLV